MASVASPLCRHAANGNCARTVSLRLSVTSSHYCTTSRSCGSHLGIANNVKDWSVLQLCAHSGIMMRRRLGRDSPTKAVPTGGSSVDTCISPHVWLYNAIFHRHLKGPKPCRFTMRVFSSTRMYAIFVQFVGVSSCLSGQLETPTPIGALPAPNASLPCHSMHTLIGKSS